jgi:hypothetical protein
MLFTFLHVPFLASNTLEGNHGRLRIDFGQFGIFFDGFPMPTNGVEAVSQTRGSFTFLFFLVLK